MAKINKLLFIFTLFLLLSTNNTGSYFASQDTVTKNNIVTGCWSQPSSVVLVSPVDNYATRNSAVNFIWNPAITACPTATITYKLQLANDPIFSSIYTESSFSTNPFYNFNFIIDGNYYWRVIARDNYGRQSTSLVRSITYDGTNPSSVIVQPFNSNGDNKVQYVYVWNGHTEGTATDSLSGVNRVELSIQRVLLNLYWNGSSWVSGSEAGTRVLATGTTSWTYDFANLPPVGVFRIIAHAIDNAGNVENSATVEFENMDLQPDPIISPPVETADLSALVEVMSEEGTPTPTVEPTISESVEPTATPTASESAEPTVEPTTTPPEIPTPTTTPSEPSGTPVPTITPESTETPSPTETPVLTTQPTNAPETTIVLTPTSGEPVESIPTTTDVNPTP